MTLMSLFLNLAPTRTVVMLTSKLFIYITGLSFQAACILDLSCNFNSPFYVFSESAA
jgi:hypothetical protein